MRTFEVYVSSRPRSREVWQETASYVCTSGLNLRAVTILLFMHHFGRAPKLHWACAGSLCMGQACDAKSFTRSRRRIEIHQQTRLSQAYDEVREILYRVSMPKLMERRSAK